MGGRPHNGLNETFEVVVNGHVQEYKTSDPRFASKGSRAEALRWDWVDLDLPVSVLRPGHNEVIVRKRPGTNDDYIYPGIDNTTQYGHSAVSMDGGKTWNPSRLNAIGAQGEYMIRLGVATVDLSASATWSLAGPVDDPHGLIAYAGQEAGALVLEMAAGAYDPSSALTASAAFRGPAPAVAWLDDMGKPLAARVARSSGRVTAELPAGDRQFVQLRVRPPAGGQTRSVTFRYTLPSRGPLPVIDLCPQMSPARGKRRQERPSCRLAGDRAVLRNRALEAVFQTRPSLALLRLHAAEVDRDVLAHPELTHLFRIKVGDRVYGCRDGVVRRVEPIENGFAAVADLPEAGLQCAFSAAVDEDELQLGLEVTSLGPATVTFHTVFPHLAGLELSADPSQDYYLFPYLGGIIANAATALRSSYGENTCWWQMVDLFSPPAGGGLYVRCDDPSGLYKNAALRKGASPDAGYTIDTTGRRMEPDMLWKTSLEAGPGVSVAFEYIRRTRRPGASFPVPTACIGSHSSDWRAALESYAAWSRKTWPPRPYPSALTSRWNIIAPGWGKKPLFRDGAYHTDYLKLDVDVAEMMSWWTWSDRGPWGIPMERVRQELGDAFYKRYAHYWVKEPATGKLMYPISRGDYDGYMPQWGGLPALRAHIQRVRAAGVLPTFYMEGILACANTKVGGKYGPIYGAMNPDWKDHYKTGKTPKGYVGSYGSYNMCSDTEWWPSYLADAVARVCRETGIDGVRLDEYGHRGYVCHNPRHKHLFAEPGHNAWMQAVARACKLVHEKMDQVRPGLVLMTEFPGNDHLASQLDGAITYQASAKRIGPIRPIPCNLFRFYFRHCKLFEINRPPVQHVDAWALWNGHAAFGYWPKSTAHRLLVENTDAFEGDRVEPLVGTLVPRVYANRFECRGKTIFTLHNASGHTVDGPLLAVEPDAGHHYVELHTARELSPVRVAGQWVLSFKLKRFATAAVARLPRRLRLSAGRVDASGPLDHHTIVAVAPDGSPLATLAPGAPVPDAKAVAIKLLREGRLVDMVPCKR